MSSRIIPLRGVRLSPKSNPPMTRHAREAASLARIAEDISSSLRFEDILDRAYAAFRGLLPYDRIGVALVADAGRAVRAIGARSSARNIRIAPGYCAPLKGSSLEKILKTGNPRVIDDLEEYLIEHPSSDSTRKIVAEGMRSSLTYPLISEGKPIGFIFFSSVRTGAYTDRHVRSFGRVATLFSLAVEKARLYRELEEADEEKSRIMGIAAHDLRNPLTVMIGRLSMMQEASGAHKENVVILERNCRRMIAIIDGLLASN